MNDGLTFALGRAVRRRRQDLGLSQKEFASLADVHYQTVGGVELGRVRSSHKLNKIARALGVSVKDLLVEADASTGSMHPDVGKLVTVLMEWHGIDEHDLAKAMSVPLDDVRRLVAGDAGPLLWGAAAMVLGVSPAMFERAAVYGYDEATRDAPFSDGSHAMTNDDV